MPLAREIISNVVVLFSSDFEPRFYVPPSALGDQVRGTIRSDFNQVLPRRRGHFSDILAHRIITSNSPILFSTGDNDTYLGLEYACSRERIVLSNLDHWGLR